MTYHYYRCSICNKIVDADDVGKHMMEEKAKPTWPGSMSWILIGSPFDTEKSED